MLTTIFLSFLENVIGWTSTRNIDYSFIFEWKDTLIFAEKYNFICPGGVKKDQNHPGFEYSLGRSRNTPTKKVANGKLLKKNFWVICLVFLARSEVGNNFWGKAELRFFCTCCLDLLIFWWKEEEQYHKALRCDSLDGNNTHRQTHWLTGLQGDAIKKSFADEGNLWIILQPKCCRSESFRLSQIRAHRYWQLSHHLHEIFNAI